jgi:hypothetical protein
MSVLHLEHVPEDLYQRLESLAAADRLPLAEEAVRLLQEAVARKQAGSGPARSQREILDEIVRGRYAPATGTPDSAELLREDRSR